MPTTQAQRILLVKIGLDGHDRGIKVVAHVIYSGLWQSIDSVVQAVRDEDVDWLGVSILNGAHMTLIPRLIEALREAGLEHVGILAGGILPEVDQEQLKAAGVAACFGPGTPLPTIIDFLNHHAPTST
jgi:methylmalonyl-CoA mutase cobalamin-binding domain/chain